MQEVFKKIVEKLDESSVLRPNSKEFYNNPQNGEYVDNVVLFRDAIEIVKQEAEKYKNGHFGCNTNGEHERCDGCGLTNCKRRNKIWFGAGDGDTDTNVVSNGWIPVSERLPEESLNSVIGWDTYRERCCFVQYLGGRFVLGDDTESVNITAWMPLPKQYKPKFVQKCVNPSRKEEIEELNKKIRSIPVCTYPTNADRIRSLSDEELAKFLIHVETLGYNDSSVSGKLEMIEWLQSEVEVIG